MTEKSVPEYNHAGHRVRRFTPRNPVLVLEILHGSAARPTFELSAPVVTLGRAPTNTVILTDYPYSGTPASTRVTMLHPTTSSSSSWDTDWSPIGTVGDSLLLTRFTGDQLEVGVSDTT